MPSYIAWPLVLAAIPLALFLINIRNWNYLRIVLNKHSIYIKGLAEKVDDETMEASTKAMSWLMSNQTEIKRRIKRAGVHSPTRTFMEPLGLGFAGQQNLDAIDNFLLKNADILKLARQTLETAKGHYLTQAKLSLNPIHWLEILIFLPKEIVSAAGIEATGKAADTLLKLVQIAYWAILAIAAYLKLG